MQGSTRSDKSDRPIIILGCPRSGTRLLARIIGGSDSHFLITEHANKVRSCPEDVSGINDTVLWWENFEYYLWDQRTSRPLVETPIYDRDQIDRVRSIYIEHAETKRLVLKNPAHLTRIRFLKEMFPNAVFVFCVRNPWHTLQSMVVKGNKAFLLKTFGNNVLPDDLLFRAAFSWSEAIEIYLRESDENWVLVKYEDLVSQSRESIRTLFDVLFIDDEEYFEKAVTLPEARNKDYSYIAKLFQANNYKSSIIRAIEPGCKLFAYPLSIDEVDDMIIREHSAKIKGRNAIFDFGKRLTRYIKRS